MWTIRKSSDRGYASHGWLESFHSFSFAEYYDQAHMSFSVLRVINDDKIAPAAGFGMHGHRDMEIITYMLAGELRHQDSIGNGAVIKAGDVQRMTAGTGVRHSEVNASSSETAHLLQIWITPEKADLTPSYEDKHIPLSQKLNQWCVIASRQPHTDVMKVHQDITLSATVLMPSNTLNLKVEAGRSAYLHVARGAIQIDQQALATGDALMITQAGAWTMQADLESEVLWFDLPAHSGAA